MSPSADGTVEVGRSRAAGTVQWVRIGGLVRSAGGEKVGRVDAVVLSPTLSHLTHVGVSPGGTYTEARFLPIVDLEPGDGCLYLVNAQRWPGAYPVTYEAELVPSEDRQEYHLPFPYASDDVLVRDTLEPPFGLGIVVHGLVPNGGRTLYAGTRVTSQDGHRIGKVAGFVLHPDGREVSHVVLRHSYLWRRHTVLLPIGFVEGLEHDTVVVRATP